MDVLIVGGGPVGLTIALALARRGLRSTVIERRAEPTPVLESRAITWMPRAIEVATALSVDAGLQKQSHKRTVHRFAGPGGTTLATIRFDRLRHPHPYTLQLPQGESERLLEMAAADSGKVEVVRGAEVIAIAQDSRSVTVTYRNPASARSRSLQARYGVAADGASSSVRQFLDVPISRVRYGARSVVADFVGTAGIPPDESVLVLDSARPRGLFPITPHRWRLIYRVNSRDDPATAATPDVASNHLKRYFPTAHADAFTWSSSFELTQGDAAAYVKGRWILAGDAAHPMGPSAGAGMMLGVLGSWRLAWALDRVRSGHPTALEEYAVAQKLAAARVQHSNALIFRQTAVTSRAFGALRTPLFALAARATPMPIALARREALVNEPLPDL